jgi:hypothetical protein
MQHYIEITARSGFGTIVPDLDSTWPKRSRSGSTAVPIRIPGGERKGIPKPRRPGIDQMEAVIQQQVRDKHVRALCKAVLLLVMWISMSIIPE